MCALSIRVSRLIVNVMRYWKPGPVITICVGICLLLALGCGVLGLAVQQRIITPRNYNIQLGPLIFATRGSGLFACPQQAGQSFNQCDRLSSARRPSFYRMWLFWYTPGRGIQSTRMIFQWTLPLRR